MEDNTNNSKIPQQLLQKLSHSLQQTTDQKQDKKTKQFGPLSPIIAQK
jgi:hypothetical protein